MIYVLLALGLIGLLTATMMRQDSADSSDLSQEQAEMLAIQIMEYTAAAQSTIDQMIMSGTNVDQLDFTFPSATSFNTAPNYNKIFHPQGGGLNYRTPNSSLFIAATVAPNPGWYIVRFNNTQWTPTAANDVMISAYGINKPVCEMLNKKITGSTVIPVYNGNPSSILLGTTHGASTNANFLTAACAGCEGKPALCISNAAADEWSFYSILLGR